jgi:hypothetical protein
MYKRKTWREKLTDDKGLPKTVDLEKQLNGRWGKGTMVIPSPIEVDAIMKKVPKGKLITINDIRARLAKDHGTTTTCPVTTGIFAWISANAAEEAAQEGAKKITPYWRTLKAKGESNRKYPGGLSSLKKKLKAEGHRIVAKGTRLFVKDLDDSLAKI